MFREILTAFLLIFVAELGDKTQLSTMLLASKSNNIWPTFIGSACALVVSSLLGVIAATFLNKYVPEIYIRYGSGLAFLLIGALLLFGKM